MPFTIRGWNAYSDLEAQKLHSTVRKIEASDEKFRDWDVSISKIVCSTTLAVMGNGCNRRHPGNKLLDASRSATIPFQGHSASDG